MKQTSETAELRAVLVRMGLLPPNGRFTAVRLGGGVSCDVWKVERPDGSALVVKRPLAKLRVVAEWRASPARWATETAWLKLAGEIDPTSAPQVLGEDEETGMFAIAFLENCPLWKSELAAGRIDADFARVTGHKLAILHARTAGRAAVARQFDHGDDFYALRLEPYLLSAAGRHPDIAGEIKTIADSVRLARIALMHGDISPKNILMTNEGPVFLDAETACYGDPAFDLAFCLNHLLLKCVWHPEYRRAYLASFHALNRAYLDRADWEKPAALEERAARLLGALLLARIDGKSPVEYIVAEADKAFVRATAKSFLKSGEERLESLAHLWDKAIALHQNFRR